MSAKGNHIRRRSDLVLNVGGEEKENPPTNLNIALQYFNTADLQEEAVQYGRSSQREEEDKRSISLCNLLKKRLLCALPVPLFIIPVLVIPTLMITYAFIINFQENPAAYFDVMNSGMCKPEYLIARLAIRKKDVSQCLPLQILEDKLYYVKTFSCISPREYSTPLCASLFDNLSDCRLYEHEIQKYEEKDQNTCKTIHVKTRNSTSLKLEDRELNDESIVVATNFRVIHEMWS